MSTLVQARSRAARIRSARAEHLPFLIILVTGAAIRLFVLAMQPGGSLGFLDIPTYLTLPPFTDPRVPGGYPIFVDGLRDIAASITLLIAVQHLLGLLGGCLVYWAARTAGLRGWPAALATAPALLAAEAIMLEHAPLTESLTIVFINAGFALTLVAVLRESWKMALLAGVALSLATSVRTIGLPLSLVCIGWALLATRGGVLPRLRVAGAVAVGVAVVLAGYLALATTGHYSGIGNVGGNYLYARVAQFADCSKFQPPPGTRGLCETTPPDQRQGTLYYQFGPGNPKFLTFPETQTDYTAHGKELQAFARAAILHQPFAYAKTVLSDYARYFEQPVGVRPQSGNGFDVITLGVGNHASALSVAPYLRKEYPDAEARLPHLRSALRLYAGVAQVGGWLLAALCILAVIGALLPSPSRRPATLAVLVVLVLTLFPVATLIYSQRYFVPAYGALGLAAAIGAQALLLRRSGRPAPVRRGE